MHEKHGWRLTSNRKSFLVFNLPLAGINPPTSLPGTLQRQTQERRRNTVPSFMPGECKKRVRKVICTTFDRIDRLAQRHSLRNAAHVALLATAGDLDAQQCGAYAQGGQYRFAFSIDNFPSRILLRTWKTQRCLQRTWNVTARASKSTLGTESTSVGEKIPTAVCRSSYTSSLLSFVLSAFMSKLVGSNACVLMSMH